MFPFELQVVSIPVKNNFRGIKSREIALFEGPAGGVNSHHLLSMTTSNQQPG